MDSDTRIKEMEEDRARLLLLLDDCCEALVRIKHGRDPGPLNPLIARVEAALGVSEEVANG